MLEKLRTTGLSWLWLSVMVFILDQWSKIKIIQNFEYGETVAVLPLFNLSYQRNPGAAFSFLAGQSGWQLWFFSGIAFFVTGLLCYWLAQQPRDKLRLNIAYTLVIGGALGNVADRIMYGYVVDFIDLYWDVYHYATFNIADVAISIGAALVVLDAVIQMKQESKTSKEDIHKDTNS